MNNDYLQSVLALSSEERFEHFLDAVGEEREVWILIDSQQHFLKIHTEDDGGFEYLPIWPSADFAAAYAKDESGLTPKSIPLPQFLKKWISGLEKDGIEVGIFPGLDKSVWVMEPGELAQDLRDELSNF